jgi:hypothetical protein
MKVSSGQKRFGVASLNWPDEGRGRSDPGPHGEPGYRVDAPTDCPEPVQWVGRAVVGHKRMRLWSCGRHVEGPADLRPVASRSPLRYRKLTLRDIKVNAR